MIQIFFFLFLFFFSRVFPHLLWIACTAERMDTVDFSPVSCRLFSHPAPQWVTVCLSAEARFLNHLSYPGQRFLYSFIPVHFHQFHVSIYQDYIKVNRGFGFKANKRGRGGHGCNISTPLSVSVNPSLTARNWNLKNCNDSLGGSFSVFIFSKSNQFFFWQKVSVRTSLDHVKFITLFTGCWSSD